MSSSSSVTSQSNESFASETHHHAPTTPITPLRRAHTDEEATALAQPSMGTVAGGTGTGSSAGNTSLSRRSVSQRQQPEEQTWSEFLREGPSRLGGSPLTSEERRMNIIAADRKRRLTGSAQDIGRRRTLTDGFQTQSSANSVPGVDSPSSSRRSSQWPPRIDSNPEFHQANFYDATRAPHSAQATPVQTTSGRPPLNTPREYVTPKWQPDSEVSECPICNRQFTWRFRRHHCRKCGRVVCDTCSPHRITIPRQFIVHPPVQNQQSQGTASVNPAHIETVDLTEDQSATVGTSTPHMSVRVLQTSNPALGGGEKVRLCNPCVPDPQPSPQADYGSSGSFQRGPSAWATENSQDPIAGVPARTRSQQGYPGLHPLSDQARELRRQRGRGMIFQPEGGSLNAVQTRSEETPEEGLPPYGTFDYTVVPNYGRRDQPPVYHSHVNPNTLPPQYISPSFGSTSDPVQGVVISPSRRAPALPNVGHSHYASMDSSTSRPAPSTPTRARIRSMFDADASIRRYVDQASSSPSSTRPVQTRPRLQEQDICPICRHALPPRGADGDETAREAHIMACIAARDPTTARLSPSQAQSPAQSPPRAPILMLPFMATEKDCVGEDGSAQECSICMVEYNVGDGLARLECLCKFHRECIVEWFARKQECPVHKID